MKSKRITIPSIILMEIGSIPAFCDFWNSIKDYLKEGTQVVVKFPNNVTLPIEEFLERRKSDKA